MYPYLLVQILKTGRISEAQLKSLPSDTSRGLAEGKEEFKRLFPNVIQGFTFNTPIYDPTTKRIWLEVSSTVYGLGVHGLQTMIPTETGFVEIDMYSKEEEFTSLAPLFRKIGTNVELSPSIAYKPRWTEMLASDAEGLNAFLPLAASALFIASWLLPGIIASRRNHPNKIAIWCLTAFLGWTGIVWIPTMIWACWRIPKPKPPRDLEPL